MTNRFSRLFRPKSVAVIGGGAWCESVLEQLQKAQFGGDIWPVHPKLDQLCGIPAFKSLADLPDAPDAAFIGINRDATIAVTQDLAAMNAGGAVCFASGFGETEDGETANQNLLNAAGDMPILGPNCYGLINALDGVALWPDQHGCLPVQSGVAILTQSSNIAINLTMQKRGLPIAYVVTCGNQAQLSEADIANALLDDPRVTAIGLHIEGFRDLPAWQRFARRAHDKGIPIVALKVGKSVEARAATVSHTASLAGSDAGAQALLNHLGIARVSDLPSLLETLKLLHCGGPLAFTRIASISCSGGEASLIADMATQTSLTFPPLSQIQTANLASALGPKVALANPLDYHTYVWRDVGAMTDVFSAIIDDAVALTFLIVDFPRNDTCDDRDWECAIMAALNAKAATKGRIAMVATLPELMPEHVAQRLMAGGVIPQNGLSEALNAAQAAQPQHQAPGDLIVPRAETVSETLTEADAKLELSNFGLLTPMSISGELDTILDQMGELSPPFALKATGLSHKSDVGGVALSLTTSNAIQDAAKTMPATTFLLEEMVIDGVAELLIGVVKDPVHGFVITLGAGGIMTELLQDTTSLLVPATEDQIRTALARLKVAKLLNGYRGKPAAALPPIIDAILSIQSYVLANIDAVEEVEVNPLIATPTRAVAVDALIRKSNV